MRFGIFLAPFHPIGQDPTLALQRDLDLICHLDRLGFDEAWIGEHHSAGYEIIASPEVFIAVAAERTERIRLGTGVSSLPYHHPLILADRMVLLDHLTRGRVMLGCGPGSLPSDAFMMGIDPLRQRDMMEEGLEAIVELLRCDEPVTMRASYFELKDARLQLRPYTQPHFEIAVAATVSPAGPRAAGRFGTGLLSVAATSERGFALLDQHWDIVQSQAAKYGQSVDRDSWRLVGPMHLADSEAQARKDVAFGLSQWVDYFREVAALPLAPQGVDNDELVDSLNASGLAVIGTPDAAIERIRSLETKSGGFGAFLLMAHEWADRQATELSYELFARYVAPHFKGKTESLVRSRDWAASNRPQFIGAVGQAIQNAITKHYSEPNSQSQTSEKGG
jgi:limonene 1,2-monooxygenase